MKSRKPATKRTRARVKIQKAPAHDKKSCDCADCSSPIVKRLHAYVEKAIERMREKTREEEAHVLADALVFEGAATYKLLQHVPEEAVPMLVWSHDPYGRLIDAVHTFAHVMQQPIDVIVERMLMHVNPKNLKEELRWN